MTKILIDKKYKIIYADPPWYFKSYSKKGEDRNATKHYPCMEFDDLLGLNINDIADVDCILFMWVIDPLLEKSFEREANSGRLVPKKNLQFQPLTQIVLVEISKLKD